jgi:hypothetical protein
LNPTIAVMDKSTVHPYLRTVDLLLRLVWYVFLFQITHLFAVPNDQIRVTLRSDKTVQQRRSELIEPMIDSVHLYLSFRYLLDEGAQLFDLATFEV